MKLTPLQQKLILLFLFLLLFALEVFVAHRYLTSQVAGANDFYSRWFGARALLLEGRDPYGVDVTADIMPSLGYGPDEAARAAFAYPLHIIFLFLPLAFVRYDWTQAIWLVTLQWLAVSIGIALMGWKQVQPKPAAALGILLAMIFFYPVSRTILLGQFTIHVTLFLVMALWLLSRGRDGWAGIFLAATSVKPQMVIFIGPWLVLWAIGQKRWRFVTGLLGGGVAMFAAALLLFPRWPISFIEDIQRYAQVAGGRNPLELLLETLWPGYPGFLQYLVTILLMGMMLYTWLQGWRDTGYKAERALLWTIVVGLITTFQTGTTNQVILVIPFFIWAFALQKKWGTKALISCLVFMELGLWILFFATISGDFENPLLFLPLPLFTLAVLIVLEWQQRRAAATR